MTTPTAANKRDQLRPSPHTGRPVLRSRLGRLAMTVLAIALVATACGAETTTDVASAPQAELSERADAALAPTAPPANAPAEEAPADVTETETVDTTVQPTVAPATSTEAAPEPTQPPAVAPTSPPVSEQATTEPATSEPAPPAAAAETAGIWPAWYQPPAGLQVVNWRDNSSGERRVMTDLTGLDYETVCNDWRAKAASAGLMPTTSKQCNDPITRWTVVESPTGADSEIQDVSETLSYDVLFVFDAASLRLGAGQAAAPAPAPTPVPPSDSAAQPAPADETDDDSRVLPAWFNPSVVGTELAHAVDGGIYEIAAIGVIGPDQTYTALCEQFVTQATGAGWSRQSSDVCGEAIFDGATFIDPVTGFEAQVRNYRANEIVYSFEVAANLTPAEITAIAFDPEFQLLPTGFTLVAGEQVIGLAESIDDTGAYNTAIQVTGAAGFTARCELLLDQAVGAQIVLGSCTSDLGLITINTGVNTTVILEDDLYTFVTR